MNIMKRSMSLHLAGFLLLAGLATTYAESTDAETPWYSHSLRLYMGSVNNAGTIDARNTYLPLKMGSDAEMGLGFTIVLDPTLDLEFTLSELSSSGTQYNAPGSGNENNALNMSLNNRRLSITGKKMWRANEQTLVPWLGLGLDGDLIETRETEEITLSAGVVSKPTLSRVSSALGAHVSAGIDLYPIKTSSLALSLEARYNAAALNGPLKGDINSAAVLIGIRWDFWPATF